MNKLVKRVSYADLVKEYVGAINGVLELTPRELELLTAMIELDMSIPDSPNTPKNLISTDNRRMLMQKLDVKPENMCRYINKLKEKGILVEGPYYDEYIINRAVLPDIIGDRVQLTIVLRIKEDGNKSKVDNN